jgi:hypothetical protein
MDPSRSLLTYQTQHVLAATPLLFRAMDVFLISNPSLNITIPK